MTTETKAKALRPYAEQLITKATAGHRPRAAPGRRRSMHDKDVTHKLFDEIAPRYPGRTAATSRILKLGPRPGDNAPMARVELV